MKSKTVLYVIAILLLSIYIFLPHTDKIAAKKTLEQNNYKVIEVGGYDFWAGNKNDWYKTKFKAIASNGDTVKGTVTKGVFSGENVIRIKN